MTVWKLVPPAARTRASRPPAAPAPAGGRRASRLFPAAPDFRFRAIGVMLAVVAVAAGTVLSLGRQRGPGALDTVWAEDGTLFLGDAVNRSPLAALVTPYAGYYQVIPRLLASFAPLVPAPAAAAALSIAAAAGTGALALLVYVASAGHLAWRWSRVLVAAVVIVVPVAMGEVPNSIANLHWPALYALFWVLLWTPSGRAGRIVAPAVVLLVAGSDIIVLAMLPLAYLRVLLRRDRYSTLLASVLTAGCAVQVTGLLSGTTSRALSPDPVRWLVWYGTRVAPGTLFGEPSADRAAIGAGGVAGTTWPALATIAWLVIALLVVLPAWLGRPNALLAAVALGQSIALYGLPALLSAYPNSRYAAAPAMLLVAALVAMATPRPWPRDASCPDGAATAADHDGTTSAADHDGTTTAAGHAGTTTAAGHAGTTTAAGHDGTTTAAGHDGTTTAADHDGTTSAADHDGAATTPAGTVPGRIRSAVVPALPLAALTVLLCLTWAANYRVDNMRARGPDWRRQVAIARHTCVQRHPTTIDVPIAPADPPTWVVRLPCEYLRR